MDGKVLQPAGFFVTLYIMNHKSKEELYRWADEEATEEQKAEIMLFIDFLKYKRELPRIRKALALLNYTISNKIV